jgi:hypothetical protein
MTAPFRVEGLLRKVLIPVFLPELIFRIRVWILLRYRRLRDGYAFRKIPLTQGKYAIVDPEDYEELTKYKWFAKRFKGRFYAGRTVKKKTVRMHQAIIGDVEGKVIDHINHNGLDNRKANLRFVTTQQNSWNRRKNRGNYSSRYKGVAWSKSRKKWRTKVKCNGRVISIGHFDDERAAAMAYDARAKKLFGEYAAPNLPSSKERGKKKSRKGCEVTV